MKKCPTIVNVTFDEKGIESITKQAPKNIYFGRLFIWGVSYENT